VPADWPGFTIHYKHRGTPYEIIVDRQPDPRAVAQFVVDGEVQAVGRNSIDLVADGAKHTVHVMWVAATAIEDLAATRNS
jgi:cellobiose phosphorylase